MSAKPKDTWEGPKIPVVVLDPGHGGEQPGAVAHGIQEKEVNLQLALKAAPSLEEAGIKVILTRDEDVEVSLARRVEITREARADLFLSLHANAGGGEGFETFVSREAEPDGAAVGKQKSLHREIMEAIAGYDIRDRGKKQANFYVLKHNPAPAVLLESLFIDHPREAELWKKEEFVQHLAGGVVSGVKAALQWDRKPGEAAEEPPREKPGDGDNKDNKKDDPAPEERNNGEDSSVPEEKNSGEDGPTSEEKSNGEDGPLFCVQVGAFSREENARDRLQEARQAGFADAFIYQKK